VSGTGTWALAVVGLGALALLWRLHRRPAGARVPRLRLVVLVKNREAVIEGFVRELFRILGSVKNVELAVVDHPLILERLGRLSPSRCGGRAPRRRRATPPATCSGC